MKSFALAAATLLVTTAAAAQVGAPSPGAAPFETKSVENYPTLVGWPEGRTPTAPSGWRVVRFAGGLDHPRQILLLPNGDVLAAEARTALKPDTDPDRARAQAKVGGYGYSANRITLLRDADRDGVAEQRFVLLDKLNQPFGLAYRDGRLFVGETGAVKSFAFQPGQTRVTGPARTLATLPAGGYNNHWTRNLLLSPDGRTLYVSVGSASNVAEHGMEEEKRRANILAIDLASGRERIYASGLRNPVGMDFAPGSGVLWSAVNERDHLGDDVSPDYLVGVKEGGFYGWPYSYYGKQDPRQANERLDLLPTTLMPDVSLAAHVSALGVAFAKDRPASATEAFVARHGSWNRSTLSGYDVLAVPFADGRPSGAPRPFLTGFVAPGGADDSKKIYGRPVSVQTRADGTVFVVDDAGNSIWMVRRA